MAIAYIEDVSIMCLVLLNACGGAPFVESTTTASDPFDAALQDATPDARADGAWSPLDEHDAQAADAQAVDAVAASDACAPVVWHAPVDGATAGPFGANCPVVGEAPSQLLPGSYAVQNYAGCFLTTTPLACRCAATYSCACLKADPSTFCTGDHFLACDDSAGAPVVTCN
jgi:hypothetical protein